MALFFNGGNDNQDDGAPLGDRLRDVLGAAFSASAEQKERAVRDVLLEGLDDSLMRDVIPAVVGRVEAQREKVEFLSSQFRQAGLTEEEQNAFLLRSVIKGELQPGLPILLARPAESSAFTPDELAAMRGFVALHRVARDLNIGLFLEESPEGAQVILVDYAKSYDEGFAEQPEFHPFLPPLPPRQAPMPKPGRYTA